MDRPAFLESGEQARLIPVAADSGKEVRAASILMAALSAVPPFAQVMLGPLGQRLGKAGTSRLLYRGGSGSWSQRRREDPPGRIDGTRRWAWP